MENKVQIHEFDPVIYPTRLWVAINPALEQISEKFYGLDSNIDKFDIDHDYFDPTFITIAKTYPVFDKQSKWIGLFVGIYKKGQCGSGVVSHESVHVADFICEQLGVSNGKFEDGEAYAYLVQWIAYCIDKVLKNKK